ncbi:Ig-like domain-containing protein [Oceanithermus sp.]
MARSISRFLLSGLLLAAFLAACNQGDTTAPEVVSLYPQDGFHGFRKDDVITIEFSEPVDINSFLAAYSSTSDGLMPDQISYRFADGGKKIFIYPGKPLGYSPDDSYVYYGFEVGTELTDLAGNHLARPLKVTFSTMRTLQTEVLSEAEFDGAASSGSVVNNFPLIAVGDNTSDAPLRGFLSFPFPEENDGVLGGTLRLYVPQIDGAPFADLGRLVLEPVDLGVELDPSDFGAVALAPGLEDDGTGWAAGSDHSYDVGDWVRQADAGGRERLQVRLRFTTDTDSDGLADLVTLFAREALGDSSVGPEYIPTLVLTYYGP